MQRGRTLFLVTLVGLLVLAMWTGCLSPATLTGPASSVPSITLTAGGETTPSLGSGPTAASAPPATPAPSNSDAPLTLTINGISATETPYFWTMDVDGMPRSATSQVAALLNQTPIKTLRYGDAWVDETNWTTGCFHDDASSCSPATGSPASFATLCQWLSDECVLGLPAETNNVSTATALIHWLATQTSWQPTCWAVGNEPQDWTHFNIPWSEWSGSDRSYATARQFAQVAVNLTGAIREISPGVCVVGIESNDNVRSTASWTSAVVSADPNVSAVAIHSYPDNHCDGPFLSGTNLTSLAREYKSAVAASDGLPVDTQEFNIGLGQCEALGTETNAVFASANAAQALELGMPQFGFFRFFCSGSDCVYDAATKSGTATYSLYSQLFTHMDIATVRNITLSGGRNAATYVAEGSDNSTDRSILLSNAATVGSEQISLQGIAPSNWTGMVYTQNTLGQVSEGPYSTGMTVSLPPLSTMVVKVYQSFATGPGNGTAGGPSVVNFTEAGLGANTPWSLTLNGVPAESTTPFLNFSESNGTYEFSVSTVVGYTAVPSSGTVVVAGSEIDQLIVFSPASTFGVRVSETGLPNATPWSADVNGVVQETDSRGETFQELNGSFEFSLPAVGTLAPSPASGQVVVSGATVYLRVVFASPLTYTVRFNETGLPLATNWTVGVGPTLATSDSDSLNFTVANGTYRFEVSPVGTFAPIPNNGSFNESGLAMSETVAFGSAPKSGSNSTGNSSGNNSGNTSSRSGTGTNGSLNSTSPGGAPVGPSTPPSTGVGANAALAPTPVRASVQLLATVMGMVVFALALTVAGLLSVLRSGSGPLSRGSRFREPGPQS
jgi:hypothetical protein